MRRLIVAAMCITALYCSSAVAADTVAERWAAAWNSHDAAKVVALFAENGVYEDVPFGSTNRGKTALRQYAETYFAAVPDMTTTITGSDGLRMPSAVEFEAARFQGRHVAQIAAKLVAS